MRKRSQLVLAIAVVLVAIGATGIGKVLAGSGTPIQLSSYGTVTVDTTYTATGTAHAGVNVAIFSSSGPFYTEKVNVGAYYGPTLPTVTLGEIIYDGLLPPETFAACPTVLSHDPVPYQDVGFGDVMSVVPSQMIDQTGAHAVPAQGELLFELVDQCLTATFPSGLAMYIEATVLAPTSATVCIVASETYPVPSCLPT